MKRQSLIYAIYAVLAAGLVVYLVPVVTTSWERFGLSLTTGVYFAVSVLFVGFCGLGAWLAFLFTARAVARVESHSGELLLVPEAGSFAAPVRVASVRFVRSFGEQFAKDESVPKFTVFSAGGRYWVTATAFPSGSQSLERTSEA